MEAVLFFSISMKSGIFMEAVLFFSISMKSGLYYTTPASQTGIWSSFGWPIDKSLGILWHHHQSHKSVHFLVVTYWHLNAISCHKQPQLKGSYSNCRFLCCCYIYFWKNNIDLPPSYRSAICCFGLYFFDYTIFALICQVVLQKPLPMGWFCPPVITKYLSKWTCIMRGNRHHTSRISKLELCSSLFYHLAHFTVLSSSSFCCFNEVLFFGSGYLHLFIHIIDCSKKCKVGVKCKALSVLKWQITSTMYFRRWGSNSGGAY